jgi:hypothetical protein
MNIQIKVSEPIANMNQRESSCVKRAASMLRANGYDVTIWWAEYLPHIEADPPGTGDQSSNTNKPSCDTLKDP